MNLPHGLGPGLPSDAVAFSQTKFECPYASLKGLNHVRWNGGRRSTFLLYVHLRRAQVRYFTRASGRKWAPDNPFGPARSPKRDRTRNFGNEVTTSYPVRSLKGPAVLHGCWNRVLDPVLAHYRPSEGRLRPTSRRRAGKVPYAAKSLQSPVAHVAKSGPRGGGGSWVHFWELCKGAQGRFSAP